MENANDFERFVLYRTEEALQMDSRGLEWNIQEKSELLQNQYINEILYRALNSTQPWNDFSFIDASGIKEFSIAMHWHVLWLRLDIYRQKTQHLRK